MNSNSKLKILDWLYIAMYTIPIISGLNQLDIKISFKIPPTAYAATETKYVTISKPDPRAAKLQLFLERHNSPLATYAQLIIEESDKYALDWTKIVAISKMESDYGKRIPQNSYNAWGMGGHNLIHFSSWEEGIKFTAKTLGEGYKQAENQGIKIKYCPSSDGCNQQWSVIVTGASKEILGTNSP